LQTESKGGRIHEDRSIVTIFKEHY